MMIHPPFCLHLRSKTMFIPAAPETTAAEEEQQAGRARLNHCWCNRTLTEVGMDDRPVGPESCQPGRACYTAPTE
jgi:hypothetical protein